jgi:hypothetical protein
VEPPESGRQDTSQPRSVPGGDLPEDDGTKSQLGHLAMESSELSTVVVKSATERYVLEVQKLVRTASIRMAVIFHMWKRVAISPP